MLSLSAEIWVGVALAVVVLLSTAAHSAIRQSSRVGLSELLEKRGRTELLSKLLARRDGLLFSLSLVRLAAVLALVLLVAHIFGARVGPEAKHLTQYPAIYLIAMLIVIVTGAALPNALVRYRGDAFLATTLPVLLVVERILYPFVVVQRVFDALVRRLSGIPKADEQQVEAEQIGKEIMGAVSEGELVGAVHEEDADMIASVMEFRDTDVRATMTPRTAIVALPATVSYAEAKEAIARQGHSRIPIYGENIDDIKGVLYAKDLLKVDDPAAFDALKMMRQVPFVPESKRIPDLLKELRQQKVHLAIVLDEYGGTAGLVTLEDILEEIVGEIADEYDASEPEPIRRIDANTLEVDARVHIDVINEELNSELPEDGDYDTVGGFVFSTLGRIPAAGEEFCHQNIRIRVIDAEDRKINWLRIEVLPAQAPT